MHEAFRVVDEKFAVSLCPFASPFLGHGFSLLEVTSSSVQLPFALFFHVLPQRCAYFQNVNSNFAFLICCKWGHSAHASAEWVSRLVNTGRSRSSLLRSAPQREARPSEWNHSFFGWWTLELLWIWLSRNLQGWHFMFLLHIDTGVSPSTWPGPEAARSWRAKSVFTDQLLPFPPKEF